MAKKEAKGLNHCHNGKYDAYSSSGAGADSGYKKGISHIIKRSNQHTDNRGYCHAANEPRNGGCSHHLKFFFLSHRCFHNIPFFLYNKYIFIIEIFRAWNKSEKKKYQEIQARR